MRALFYATFLLVIGWVAFFSGEELFAFVAFVGAAVICALRPEVT